MGQFLRILLIALALWLIIRAIRRLFSGPRRPPAPPKSLPDGTPMLPCAHCGTYVPRAEAILVDGKPFCSESHAKLGKST